MPTYSTADTCHICDRTHSVLHTADGVGHISASSWYAHSLHMPIQTVTEDSLMKVVVVKSPKFLSGILRLVFGIKKEKD